MADRDSRRNDELQRLLGAMQQSLVQVDRRLSTLEETVNKNATDLAWYRFLIGALKIAGGIVLLLLTLRFGDIPRFIYEKAVLLMTMGKG